jgi:hypothetical protein
MSKQITHAVQRGPWITVYSGNASLFQRSGELVGYTGGSVSVRKGGWIMTYNAAGATIARSAG